MLILLSQGLARRLDAAYYATAVTLVVGMAASLLKGFDYEEAALLLLTLVILIRARPGFDRRAAFFETRFSASWLAAVADALVGSLWIGFFAFKHVAYSHELWWQFELDGEASRFLRASVAAGHAGRRGSRLIGGRGTLTTKNPVMTVESYWPYATTLFDYVRRAMPFQAPRLAQRRRNLRGVGLYPGRGQRHRQSDGARRPDAATGADAQP